MDLSTFFHFFVSSPFIRIHIFVVYFNFPGIVVERFELTEYVCHAIAMFTFLVQFALLNMHVGCYETIMRSQLSKHQS